MKPVALKAWELKRLHMAAERGQVEKPAQRSLDTERLYIYLHEFGKLKKSVVDHLVGGGFDTLAKVADADDRDLEALPTIGSATVANIRDLML